MTIHFLESLHHLLFWE